VPNRARFSLPRSCPARCATMTTILQSRIQIRDNLARRQEKGGDLGHTPRRSTPSIDQGGGKRRISWRRRETGSFAKLTAIRRASSLVFV